MPQQVLVHSTVAGCRCCAGSAFFSSHLPGFGPTSRALLCCRAASQAVLNRNQDKQQAGYFGLDVQSPSVLQDPRIDRRRLLVASAVDSPAATQLTAARMPATHGQCWTISNMHVVTALCRDLACRYSTSQHQMRSSKPAPRLDLNFSQEDSNGMDELKKVRHSCGLGGTPVPWCMHAVLTVLPCFQLMHSRFSM